MLVPFTVVDDSGVQVSKGFLSGAQEPLQALLTTVKSRLHSTAADMELWFCGHSLGGACAKTALLHLAFSRAATRSPLERAALQRSWVGCVQLALPQVALAG